MKRYAPLWLFVLALTTPFVLRRSIVGSEPVASAGGLRLVIISPQNEPIRREFSDAFSNWYLKKFGQPVTLDFRNYGGASEIVTFFKQSQALLQSQGTLKIDLVWGGGDFMFEQQLKPAGFLQPAGLEQAMLDTVYPRRDLAGVKLYDYDPKQPKYAPQWFGAALASFGVSYNKDVLRYLSLPEPRHWKELTNPAYRGWIVCADPTQSASARQAFMVIVEKAMADSKSPDEGWARGMGTVRQIAANARMFTASAEAIPAIISTGDAAAGMSIDFYARSEAGAVGDERMGYIEPRNETAISPDPIAMVKGAEHPELAKRFIEFILSEQGQRLWNTRPGAPDGPRSTALRRLPIRASVYANNSDFTDKANPFETSSDFNKSSGREQTFGIIGDFIEMSCIDLLGELRQTRQDILASPRAAALDAKLGMFPFGQSEALHRAALLKAATPLEALALKRKWTQDFREEYRRLREEANAR